MKNTQHERSFENKKAKKIYKNFRIMRNVLTLIMLIILNCLSWKTHAFESEHLTSVDFSSDRHPPKYTDENLAYIVAQTGSVQLSNASQSDRYLSRWDKNIYLSIVDQNDKSLLNNDALYNNILQKILSTKKLTNLTIIVSSPKHSNMQVVVLNNDQNSLNNFLKLNNQFSRLSRRFPKPFQSIEYTGAYSCIVQRDGYNIMKAVILIEASISKLNSYNQKINSLVESCISEVFGIDYSILGKKNIDGVNVFPFPIRPYQGYFLQLLYLPELKNGMRSDLVQSILVHKIPEIH